MGLGLRKAPGLRFKEWELGNKIGVVDGMMERVSQGQGLEIKNQTQLPGATKQFLVAGTERLGEACQMCSHVRKEKEPRKWRERQVGVGF